MTRVRTVTRKFVARRLREYICNSEIQKLAPFIDAANKISR